MINILPKNNKGAFKLVLEPRRGCKRLAKEKEFELIYGHKCPVCSNVIQAFFRTDQPINLWPYEETVLLSQGEKNAGDIRKIYPDDKTKHGNTCYRSVFNPIDGGSQKIVLKNHILNHRAIKDKVGKLDGSGIWEVGERACLKTGIFALREDLLVKDILLFSGLSEYDIVNYKIPDLKSCISKDGLSNWDLAASGDMFRLSESFGTNIPVVLVERDAVVSGFAYQLRQRISKFHKNQLK